MADRGRISEAEKKMQSVYDDLEAAENRPKDSYVTTGITLSDFAATRGDAMRAANLIALAPGKVVIYRSAEGTLAELAKHGYSIIDINDVQTGAVKLDLDAPGKWALKIKGSELSRGHGGPHSLVLPLVRDA